MLSKHSDFRDHLILDITHLLTTRINKVPSKSTPLLAKQTPYSKRKIISASLLDRKAIDWYWKAKRWKSASSQAVQFLAVVLTAAAGIVPIVLQLLKVKDIDSGLLASLFVGIAAALVALDKAFGYSSGWTRYVLTAASMTKQLQEFRMDWVAATAADPSPTTEKQAAMIQRARDFISTMESIVLEETKDWATEFQRNLSQMERDLKSQLESLKAQVDKAAKEKEGTTVPGAVELTVTNADKADGFSFDVTLEGRADKFTEGVANSKVWSRIQVSPGQYAVRVNAKSKGSNISTSSVVQVKPGETATPSVTLPI